MVKRFVKYMCASLALVGGFVQAEVTLNGAGASFPKPLYDKLIAEYSRIKPDVKINYVSVGSGAGIKQFSEGTIDFGGTDSPMKPEQMEKAVNGPLFHIPTALGSVVPIYNVDGVDNVKFSGPVLAEIFMGGITKWNDSKIAALNGGISLPDADITVIHRSDSSGTTSIFTDFLAKVSPEFKSKVGHGTSVKWTAPSAVGAKGNEQVAAMVAKTKNSIGYSELIFALANNIKFAPVQNKAGKFVLASLDSTSAAASSLDNAPADLRMSITNADGEDAYPIAGLTWILVSETQKDAAKGAALVDFLTWVTHDGQAISPTLHYAPLPKALVEKIEAKLAAVKDASGAAIKK